ncbi:hypothetical protein BTVI_64179 [Pitangus sulphuratus]|nr:hypothetical protein BTVI_64179 [Pitangus sulphuratus]
MGQTTSIEHKLYFQALHQILKSLRYHSSDRQVNSLLLWVKSNRNCFQEESSFNSKIWELVGEHLQAMKQMGLDIADELLVTWRFIFTTLSQLQPAEKVLEKEGEQEDSREHVCDLSRVKNVKDDGPKVTLLDPGLVNPGMRPDLCPPLMPMQTFLVDNEKYKNLCSVPPMEPPLTDFVNKQVNDADEHIQHTSKTVIQFYMEEVLKQGDFSFAFSEVYYPNQPPTHEAVPYPVFKELKKSIMENGIQSPFTLGLVEMMASSNSMVPWDWKTLIQEILNAVQFSAQQLEYQNMVVLQALDKIQNGVSIDEDTLSGTGPQVQVHLDHRVFGQAARMAVTAWG